ncbi:MAG: flavin reductase family protein [Lewinellaceae bacterium]|nr:flavin reductase family protein [Lewinellaceae bacterium]
MLVIDPKSTPVKDLHQFMVGSIAPRPIAFVSTIDEDGNPNLAPYSFFNAFSSNPPVVIFSSNRRVKDNTTKDTLSNVLATREVVINVVNHAIVRQMAIASGRFEKGVSEFEKAGLTPIPSDLVKPFRVKESPVQMECKVDEVITLGEQGGAGHLVVCHVQRIHIDESVVDENNRINPHKLDLMGRLGRAYYVRASGAAIYTIPQSEEDVPIGFDQLPEKIKFSTVLTGNEVGLLAGLVEVPSKEQAMQIAQTDERVKAILAGSRSLEELHAYVAELLEDEGKQDYAGSVAWVGEFLEL